MRNPAYCFSLFIILQFTACQSPSEIAKDVNLKIPERPKIYQLTEKPIPPNQWFSTISSPELVFLLEEAFVNNLDLSAGAAKVLIAEARAIQSGADRLPQLSAGLSSYRRKANLGSFSGSTNNTIISESHQLGLDLSWEIDIWGRIANQQAAAKEEFKASQSDWNALKLSITARICQGWFNLIAAQQQLDLAQNNYTNIQQSTRQIQDLYKLGIRPALDVKLANTNLANAESLLNQTSILRDQTARELEILLGRYPANNIQPVSVFPEVPLQSYSWLPAELLHHRPDIQAAQSRLIASHFQVKISQKQLLPQIRLTGSTGTASNELSDLLDSNFSVWNIAGNLLQPIFQGRKLSQNVEIQKANAEQLIAQYKKIVLQAFLEVESTLSRAEFIDKKMQSEQIALQEAKDAEEIAWQRYQDGLTDISTFLETERNAFQTKSNLISTQNQSIQNFIQLHLALANPAIFEK